MYIKLNDGKSYEISSYQVDNFSILIPFKQIVEIANLMTRKNVSEASIFDKDGTEIYKFKTVKFIGLKADIKDNDNADVKFSFEEVPYSEIELAEQRAEMEAVKNIIVIGLNYSDPEEVVRWCKYLPDWNGYKFPYRKGERFKYKEKPYECLNDHISTEYKTPDKSPAIYKEVTKENKPTYPEWQKGKEYNKGDIVIYNGGLYECTWDKNTREPTGLGWKKYQEK